MSQTSQRELDIFVKTAEFSPTKVDVLGHKVRLYCILSCWHTIYIIFLLIFLCYITLMEEDCFGKAGLGFICCTWMSADKVSRTKLLLALAHLHASICWQDECHWVEVQVHSSHCHLRRVVMGDLTTDGDFWWFSFFSAITFQLWRKSA